MRCFSSFTTRYLLAAGCLLGAGRLRAQVPAATGFQRLPSGTEYQLFKKANGHYVPRMTDGGVDPTYQSRQGKFLLAHVTYLTGRDSMLQSTRRQLQNHPVPLPLLPVTKKGGQEEALALVQPGDSAVFRFPTNSVFEGRPVPAELKRDGDVLVLRVVGVRIIDQREATAMQQQLQQVALAEQKRQLLAYTAAHRAQDDAQIVAYLKEHQLGAAKKLPDGTWYAITRPGTGPLPKAGDKVSVRYRGLLLATGKEFDSSAKRADMPFTFTLGAGQVIPGWDEGLTVLPKGSKGVLLIPSSLAYGEAGSPPLIPASANLRFDVEMVDVQAKAAPKAKPAAKSLDWVQAKMRQSPASKRPPAKKPVLKK